MNSNDLRGLHSAVSLTSMRHVTIDRVALASIMLERELLGITLLTLLDWMRENTGPRDANSPHALMVTAAAALADSGLPS